MTAESTPDRRLPEDGQFRAVVIGCCVVAGLFIAAFVIGTLVAMSLDLGLLTDGWYEAWGTWAGGAATAAAFLIAAFSIRVTSAHAHADRQEAADIRKNNDMAQARLLAIYKVRMPEGIESLATFRIENRSKDVFFDVSVPFVDSPYGSDGRLERRTPDLVEAENRLHEYIPTSVMLTPYRDSTDHEAWFTLVTVHTADWQGIQFAVEYTDSSGLRWRQRLGGAIERIETTEAIAVREADRFQPRQQIRRMSWAETWRMGGKRAKTLMPPETDEEFLEILEVSTVTRWEPIELVGEPVVRSGEDTPGEVEVTVKFKPKGPPFWKDHFRKKLDENGFGFTQGNSGGQGETQVFRCSEAVAARAGELLSEAIEYANGEFEERELAFARRALEARQSRRR
ncbi:hypothetical protein ABQE44_25645 [Mycolicibacterium sp. XJ2546]